VSSKDVNFIYGQNGSGKSAILAAIQICLGAGARGAHRARKLKELVRKDASSSSACAKIQVTLLNGGGDGHHPEVYGDTITVERSIAMMGSGYNGYKLFDHQMRERSRSKKDLADILDKLNMQVENPVAILDQEEAKLFLKGKATEKYAFFMKATQLDRVEVSYDATLERKKSLDDQSEKIRRALTADMEVVAETKKAYEQHKELAILEVKQCRYEELYAWAKYGETQETLELELGVRIQNVLLFCVLIRC
jgi:chromosome segregation ATPase